MGDVRHEPSMEDILASIKRIIAEDGAAAVAAPRTRSPRAPRADAVPEEAPVAPQEDHVLELTDPVPEPAAKPAPAPLLVSDDAAQASRQSLAALSAMVVRPEPEAADALPANTLEGLVRELLRPMLKEWLDAKLPELVEGLVAKEIARITGKSL